MLSFLDSLDKITEDTQRPESDFQAKVKAIEDVTNHDIKAVEYYVKERLQADQNIAGNLN